MGLVLMMDRQEQLLILCTIQRCTATSHGDSMMSLETPPPLGHLYSMYYTRPRPRMPPVLDIHERSDLLRIPEGRIFIAKSGLRH